MHVLGHVTQRRRTVSETRRRTGQQARAATAAVVAASSREGTDVVRQSEFEDLGVAP